MRKGPKAYLAFGPCFMRTQPTCPIRIRAWQIYRPPLVFAVAASTAFKSYSLTSHCAKLVSSSPSAPIRKPSDAFSYLKGTVSVTRHLLPLITHSSPSKTARVWRLRLRRFSPRTHEPSRAQVRAARSCKTPSSAPFFAGIYLSAWSRVATDKLAQAVVAPRRMIAASRRWCQTVGRLLASLCPKDIPYIQRLSTNG